MFVEVIPLARLPKNLFRFDYKVPENFLGKIKIGQIVMIPFRKKKINGIITAIKNEPAKIKTEIKPFIKIVDFDENLDKKNVEFLEWFSDYYLTSPAFILKTFFPSPPLRSGNFKIISKPKSSSLGIPKTELEQIRQAVKKIISSKKPSFLFHYKNSKNKIAVFLKCAEKLIFNDRGILVLLPQVSDVLEYFSYFSNLFPGKIALLHGELSKTEYWQEWQKIKKGEVKIVIGTRSALFAPLKNLGLIIIDPEESSDFKQSDQNPRYDARNAALKLAEIYSSKIIFASQSPRPETYFKSQNNPNFSYLYSQKSCPPSITLIDMNDEIKNKNFSCISEEIRKKISDTISKKQKSILFLNRRGAGNTIVCRDCDHVFRCKNCDTPLSHREGERGLPGKFVCCNCDKEESVQFICPKCRGANIKYLGIGTQTVEKEIKKIFSGVNILRIDKDSEVQNFNLQISAADVIIGTQFFIKHYLTKVKNTGMVGVISADTLIYRPDFRSGEKMFSWLTKIANFSREIKNPLFIQTFFPNNFIIQSIVREEPDSFYLEELDNRQMLKYPPFGKIIKLVYGNTERKICLDEGLKIFKALENNLKEKINIFFDPEPKKEKNKYFSKIIIKFPENFTVIIKDIIKKIVPDSWTIDIDPENIL